MLRYFFPEVNNEQYLGGTNYEYLEIHRRDRDVEADIESRLGAYYDSEPLAVRAGLLDTLSDLQQC